ncbi:MAG: PAS domain S-box protein [Cyclobacteriaceae bacterium]|nr:PAS domain S-box protein [Cyclobacteriaceae bacterium]
MNSVPIRVLLIEDDEDDVLIIRKFLMQSEFFQFEITWEPNPSRARILIEHGNFDVFLIDYLLGIENGLDLVRFAHEKNILKPSILLTGKGDLRVDIDASRFGAADYIIKSELNASMLERSIRYGLTQAKVIKELDEKEKKYSSLFERSVDPIFLATEDFKLLNVNKSFLDVFGYELQEGSLYIENLFAHKADYEFAIGALKDTEQIKDFEVELLTRLGVKKWFLFNCIFIPDQASDFCCYQGIMHDITLRKQAEKEMLETERLSLTGKMARTIAHEVRNPLTNLTLAIEHINDELPEGSEAIKVYTEIIERNALRIEELIGELLNSSKPKELNLQLVDVQQLVEETLELAIDRINFNNVVLHKSFAENLPRILLDKTKIKIALINIIINAIEAMTGERRELSLILQQQDNTVLLQVKDTGRGMSADELEKLFDPFFTAKPNGLGLGLTSTKNILKSHNAGILVESELNEGTVFTLQFILPG